MISFEYVFLFKLEYVVLYKGNNQFFQGMRYLSNSSIRCHGNLKSRNCIIDSRWVLKITDYYLNEIYALQNSARQVDIIGLYKRYLEKLFFEVVIQTFYGWLLNMFVQQLLKMILQ